MLKRFVKMIGGDPVKQALEAYADRVALINSLETQFEALSEEQLRAKTDEFRQRLKEGESLEDILPEAFAVVREASKRTLGLRHFDVQLIGGMVLHEGKIAEMKTGEGKTLAATLPLYINALSGKGTHLITVNDYLARRDARWMAPIYNLLGLSVGVLQMATRTEGGKKAYLVDLNRTSPHEDQHQLRMAPRAAAYAADITYGTNSEFGFDYLRDNMAMRLEDRVQRGHHYAIIDEVDNVLIDEARTPLIISGPAHEDTEWYIKAAEIVRRLKPEDYEVNERDRTVTLTELGESRVEDMLGMPLRDPEQPEDITPEQARILGYLEQALRAQFLFHRNKDYIVQAGKVIIVDEFTGRLMPGRRWSDGLHQAVEAKEGVRIQRENVTYATITIQNYFRMYEKLAGMTGTAVTEAEEFHTIYNLDVLAIPTNLEYQAMRPDAELVTLQGQDESGYRYTYYAHRDDPEKKPIFWKRKDYPDVVYRTQEAKLRAITLEILLYHALGRPMLVGTTSVELSERISSRLRASALRRLAQVQLIRSAWLEAHNYQEDGRLIPELEPLYKPLMELSTAPLRNMARELGISFNPESPENLKHLRSILFLPKEAEERLAQCLQAGISHQVLNARKHTEESQIIAKAGGLGAVTIATNMAGRGVDIKLGGELPEHILSTVNRVLRRSGHPDPYDLTMEERQEALLRLSPTEYGIYEEEVQSFLKYMENMALVKSLGGLHVIGSERHESRRIDNQLRGRSARQGDPGSSRFYLSLEDDLMRLFGGQQVDSLMQRLKMDDAVPIEHGIVGRVIEQAQTRVEGANFDTRKHLLEYDDVLNTQRAHIYAQRERIFIKEDLSEDVTEMLREEVAQRVPQALEDEEGPWMLLRWLDQIQPPLVFQPVIFPTFTMRLLAQELLRDGPLPVNQARQALINLAEQALQMELDHHLRSVNHLLDLILERLDSQLTERMETLDTFLEGLELNDEAMAKNIKDLQAELVSLLQVPIRLSAQQWRQLLDNTDGVEKIIREQVEQSLIQMNVSRLLGAVERRLNESLDVHLPSAELVLDSWDELAEQVLQAVQSVYDRRRKRYIGDDLDGPIVREIDAYLNHLNRPEVHEQDLYFLLMRIPMGEQATFDRKSHRRVWKRTTRLNFTYVAAQFINQQEPEAITEEVLQHLVQAQNTIRRFRGLQEWNRIESNRLDELDQSTQNALSHLLEEHPPEWQNQPLKAWPDELRSQIVDILGRQALTHTYRQLLLNVISQLWVDYLTQMEALRVSIGLEAYAQRDPLVQYKTKSFELFNQLLRDIRRGVVTSMFVFRSVEDSPKRKESAKATRTEGGSTKSVEKRTLKKKKRRRRRR